MYPTIELSNHQVGEDDATTLYPESHTTVDSTLVTHSKLYRLLLARLSDSGYLSQKNEKSTSITNGDDKDQQLQQQTDDFDKTTVVDDDNQDEKEDPYRWLILLGGFLAQAIRIMQDYYDRQVFKGSVDSTQLSFVGTIGFSFCGLMGPISQIITSAIGPRWVLLIGTILTSAGLILASFSVEVWHLYMTQSLIHGMGAALLYIVSMSLSPQWFNKRRGFAMGVMVSGSGVGGLIMPFLMNELNENLGGAWCYRVLGIISFAISLISTVLLKEKKESSLNNKAELESVKKSIRWSDVVDFSICKDSKFVIWCVAGNLSMMAYFIPAFFLPSHATKLGLTPSQGSLLVAVFSAVNVIGRVIYLGDHLGVVNIDIIFLFVCGMSSLFIWSFAASYAALMIFIVTYGFMSGAVFSLLAPITAAITGMERYPSGISLYLFFMTAARLGPSMAGAIQTATDKNSFFAQQLFTGLAFVLSAAVTVSLKFKLKRGVFVKI
ncbi:major facilitator superfamily domain-containing protein [Halteromyces radiatus]|uniref:major facilitator superfamily domain-containing protein n=1 Tax=Halteromyces radiatus TaxID=101107 RepID=UPI00221EC995|nr:major facilitator superfamily domain-containing protein [Halteromyces radiatus]KAI8092883.1 major facilitator superfamily domain-containing protein [Halteromyces radiatus]